MKKFLKRRFLPFLAVFVLLIGTLMLPIGAEYEEYIDWTLYPTSNWMRYPYASTASYDNGIDIIRKADGRIMMQGTASSYLEFWFVSFYELPVDTYCLSWFEDAAIPGLRMCVNLDKADNSFEKLTFDSGPATFYVDSSVVTVGIRFEIDKGTVLNHTFSPMLTKGSTAYPYQPYIPHVIDNAYNAGYYQGSEDYTKLQQNASLNIFRACSLSISVNNYANGFNSSPTNSFYLSNVPVVVDKNNVLKFTTYSDYILNKIQEQDSSVIADNLVVSSVLFSWSGVSDFEGAFSLTSDNIFRYCFDDLPSYSISIPRVYGYLNGSSVSYSSSVSSDDNSKYFRFHGLSEGFSVSSISFDFGISVGRLSVFDSFWISTDVQIISNAYRDGYVNGYFDGENAKFSDVKETSYQEGYHEGFLFGKKEGLSIAQHGDWKNLMLAVTEAPINTFQSLFNFDVLGLDMRAAFGSVLAVCVVLIIIKKVIL